MSSRAVARRRGLPVTPGVAVPADRRFRRPDVRPARRRRVGARVWRLAALALAGAVVLAAAGWAISALLGSRMLAVSQIAVHGNARLSTGEVEALLDGIRGESLMLVNLDRYRKRLLESPWVADVTLWRILPSTVDVRITERVPMAVARLGDQLYLVDRTGVVIDEFGPAYQQFDLPIVDGLVGPAGAAGPAVDRERVQLTGRFLESMQARPDLARRISQIDVSDARDVIALFEADPARLHLGTDQFVERVLTYLSLTPMLRDRFPRLDSVDLRFGDRVFVKSAGGARAVPARKDPNR